MNRISENGRTMIEVIGVLAIITAVTIALTKMVNKMHDRFKISQITQEITDLRKNVSNRYVANGDYTGITDADIISGKVAPSEMVDGDKLVHAYNGDVEIIGDHDSYKITFSSIPHSACVELALMNWNFNGSTDLFEIKINETEFKWPLLAGTGPKLPVEITDATTACSPPPPKDDSTPVRDLNDNEITWTFR